jgi:pimeloyl-ACP methyl ester carboxylesterase
VTSTERGSRISTYRHDSLSFDVLDDGPLDGEAVLLLHGFPQRASQWREVSRLLHAQGLRTLAPDQRGYSPGARPRGPRAYRLHELVGDTVALIDRYGAPVHLVGHDWGAAVAWATAAAHPDLVRTLTTVSVPHPDAFVQSLRSSDQALRSWYFLLFQPPGLVELLARRAPTMVDRALRRGGLTEQEVVAFRSEIVEYGALPGALRWYRALPFGGGPPVGAVRVPTTHVWSDRDTALARRGAELTAGLVHAPYELVVLRGRGHWIPTHAPGPLSDAILARVRSVSG